MIAYCFQKINSMQSTRNAWPFPTYPPAGQMAQDFLGAGCSSPLVGSAKPERKSGILQSGAQSTMLEAERIVPPGDFITNQRTRCAASPNPHWHSMLRVADLVLQRFICEQGSLGPPTSELRREALLELDPGRVDRPGVAIPHVMQRLRWEPDRQRQRHVFPHRQRNLLPGHAIEVAHLRGPV